MSRRRRFDTRPRVAMVGLLAGMLLAQSARAAEPQGQDALIRAQLAAGEFAPALAAARAADDPVRRDGWLARIAMAQARAGARDAALRSAAEIYDDRTRAGSLAQLAAQPWGARGGGAQADFQPLMDLITSTIAPTTWDEVGGPGSLAEFPTGVYVDPLGVLRLVLKQEVTGRLGALRAAGAAPAARQQDDVRRSSPLRMVSLPRLEKHVQLRLAVGRQPTEAMQVLAGLRRIKYVFVYPESGDLVLAGPAGDWRIGEQGHIVGTDSGQPVLRLDDLVVVFRRMMHGPEARFGCAITPTQDALARAKAFLSEPPKTFNRPAERQAWVQRLRSALGRQQIEVYGLDPRTRAARLMVEADYRMKLVGMGLEEGVPGVQSYLDSIKVAADQAPPPLGVLRWWFTLDYDALLGAEDYRAFEIRGQGLQVLSENEHLTAQGKRVHTGKSEALNRQFARSFTENFAELCEKYPVYAELRNLCDLALVGALIRQQDLAGQSGWHMTCFNDDRAYRIELGTAPKEVETVANYRVVQAGRKIHTITGVSGGVRVDPAGLVAREAIEIDRYGSLANRRSSAAPGELPPEAWWWD